MSDASAGVLLRVNRVQRFCVHDGPGIRTTVFLQGCPLRCGWCHNPETLAAESPDARDISPADLLAELERDAAYWAKSGGGITISGGEPLFQAGPVAGLAGRARAAGYHVAVDTSGAGSAGDVRRLAPHVSLWLWDVKAVTPQLAEQGTGDSLREALDNLAWVLAEIATPVWVRLPLIAGFNTTEAELAVIADWIAGRARVPPVQILPGHAHGAAKKPSQRPAGQAPVCTTGQTRMSAPPSRSVPPPVSTPPLGADGKRTANRKTDVSAPPPEAGGAGAASETGGGGGASALQARGIPTAEEIERAARILKEQGIRVTVAPEEPTECES